VPSAAPNSAGKLGRVVAGDCNRPKGRRRAMTGGHEARQSRPRRPAVHRTVHRAKTWRHLDIPYISLAVLDVNGPRILLVANREVNQPVFAPGRLGTLELLVHGPRIAAGNGDGRRILLDTPEQIQIDETPDFLARAGAEHDVRRVVLGRYNVRGLRSVLAVQVQLRGRGIVNRKDEHELAVSGGRGIHNGEHCEGCGGDATG
jgi:hypothetical protein